MGRYVPLAVWVIVLLTLLAIPLRIISFGYLPGDDALRHAAKAVSGKPWGDILVLGPAFHDQNFVWHDFLRQIYFITHCSTDALVVVEVVLLFALVALSPLPWLRRPETWLIVLTLVSVTSVNFTRMLLGRPFVLTQFVFMTVLCAWQFRGKLPARWPTFLGLGLLIALCTLVHGIWYLWALPIMALFFAGEIRWGIGLGIAWLSGALLGALFTGHPLDSLMYAFTIGMRTMNSYATGGAAMVPELQPFSGDFLGLCVLGGVFLVHHLGNPNPKPWKNNAVFWMVCIGWVLGFKAYRFWCDWGWPALMVLAVSELQPVLEARLPIASMKRLALAVGVAIMTFLATTNNASSGWSNNLTKGYLTQDNPDFKGWMPDDGGIVYTVDIHIFFDTFFKNPTANWKYILGFEPALMPDEDFTVYRTIRRTNGKAWAYLPWVNKMHSQDRMFVRGGGLPPLPQLEWKYDDASDIWIGRLPVLHPAASNK